MSHRGWLNQLQSFAYWTDCNVATYEVAIHRKGTSGADLRRFHDIAKEMLDDLVRFTNAPKSEATEADKNECKQIQERFAKAVQAFQERERAKAKAKEAGLKLALND